jgi:hypothetical protein
MELIEDSAVIDVFVNGIAKLERLSGGLIRLSFYVERRDSRGEMEHALALRVVRSLESLSESIKLTALFLARPDLPMVSESLVVGALDS